MGALSHPSYNPDLIRLNSDLDRVTAERDALVSEGIVGESAVDMWRKIKRQTKHLAELNVAYIECKTERDALRALVERHPAEMQQAAQMGEDCATQHLIERLTSDEAVTAAALAGFGGSGPRTRGIALAILAAALRVAKGEG